MLRLIRAEREIVPGYGVEVYVPDSDMKWTRDALRPHTLLAQINGDVRVLSGPIMRHMADYRAHAQKRRSLGHDNRAFAYACTPDAQDVGAVDFGDNENASRVLWTSQEVPKVDGHVVEPDLPTGGIVGVSWPTADMHPFLRTHAMVRASIAVPDQHPTLYVSKFSVEEPPVVHSFDALAAALPLQRVEILGDLALWETQG